MNNIVNEINQRLKTILNDYPKSKVKEAMLYSLQAGGKRIRPFIVLQVIRAYNQNYHDYIDIACALEMIHTYSLIHDDLPGMDNDDLRRGKKTNHIVYGEDMAILAGDALLNYAFEVMLSNSIDKENPNKYLKAINEIAKTSGIYGMIGGQVVDIQSENKQISKEMLDYIHNNKTAAIIIGCMRAGAIIGDATQEQLEKITKYAKNIGLSFQIVDDILDIVGDESKLGKKVGSDIENHKSTYPSLIGLDESKNIAYELIQEAKESINSINKETKFLSDLADYIRDREY